LPLPHIAWSGAPPPLPKAEFVALANGDSDLARALGAIQPVPASALLGQPDQAHRRGSTELVRMARR
jgi:hypothetical protein